jgi:peptidoglycan/xylan/chitin deacetylase (PgdA/CDA1 family)
MRASFSMAVKQVAAALVYRSGFLRLWIRWKLKKRPLLVLYHRVLEPGEDFSGDGIVVHPKTFEKQLNLLARMFKIVPLTVACENRAPYHCAITFDDGWADNYSNAFPILRRLGFPATLFVTTGYIASEPRMLDWDQVRDLHREGFEIGGHTVSHDLLTEVDSVHAVRELEQSRDHIAEKIGSPPQSFAYPYGNWNSDLAEKVRRAGYLRAVTTELPWKTFQGVDANFALPRKNLWESSSEGFFGFSRSVFACEAVGFFDWCRGLWKRP